MALDSSALLSRLLSQGASIVKTKLDGWSNSITGVGMTGLDKATGISHTRDRLLTPRECSDLFHFDDFASQIVGAVPEDATREGIEILRASEEDSKGLDLGVDGSQEAAKQLSKRLEELDALGMTKEAMLWARCVGGAGILGIFDGAGLPHEPLIEARISRIVRFIVVDREDLSASSYYQEGPKIGEPEIYNLNHDSPTGMAPSNTRVHESRIVWFRGASTSRKERARNGGWDHSVLQRSYRTLAQVNGGWGSVIAMIQDMSQAVFKLSGLINGVSAEDKEEIAERIRAMDFIRSVMHAVVLDADNKEEYSVVERGSVVGLDALIDRMHTRLAATARMPVTRLMGQSPGGLNATGDADIRWWYDTIGVAQRLEIRPRYLTLVRWVALEQKLGIEGWDIRFPPLWKMSPAEEASLRKSVADTDAIYIDKAVLLPEEVTLSRWGNGIYSPEYTVDLEARKALLESIEERVNPPEPKGPPTPPIVDPNAPPKEVDPNAPPVPPVPPDPPEGEPKKPVPPKGGGEDA